MTDPAGRDRAMQMRDWEPHVRSRLSSLRLSPARENEIVEELSQHLDDRWRELVAGGTPEDEAARLALAEFREGNLLAQYLAPLRQAQTPAPIVPGAPAGHVLGGLWHDARYAMRSMRKQPAFTLAAVMTLALGIGANTAIFSVVESVLLNPLPYPDEGRIVRVGATTYSATDRASSFSPRGYWHFANGNRTFAKFGGYRLPDGTVPLTGGGPPLMVAPAAMTLSAFEVLGVQPERGRLPTAEEDAPGGARVVLISHDLWVSQYGSDPSIVGRGIDVSGTPSQVIGIMPAGYDFPTPDIDLWTTLRLNPASQNFSGHNIRGLARLAPGVTIEAAIEDARSLARRFDEAGYGPTWLEDVFNGGAVVRPLREDIVGTARQPLLIVMGTVGLILLIACSNVANLLLVRADGKRQEHAVRMALGCSRMRLVRHMLIESGLLAIVGGAAGVLLAYAGTRALVSIGPAIPRLGGVGINGAVLAFTAIMSVLAGLLFGVLPALRASSTRTLAEVRDGGRGATFGRNRHRARNTLVTTQIALAFVLVIGSGLMVRTFAALRAVDPGFSVERVLTFQLLPLPTKYGDHAAVARFYDRLTERLKAVPGVMLAGAIDTLPLTGDDNGFAAVIDDFPPAQDELAPVFKLRRVAPGYFEAMGIDVVDGRTFTADDHNLRRASVIISQSVKDQYWPGTDALGKRITIGKLSAQVVGVVGDVHDASLDAPADQFLYLPILDAAGGGVRAMAMTMTIRTAVEPLSVVSAVRRAVAELDGDLAMAEVQSMERVLGDSMRRTSFTMLLLVIAALIALVLGAVGIYGVQSYVVSQRTAEIGIRSALGATPGSLRRMVLSHGMQLAGAGLLLGFLAALALGQVMVSLLYGVNPVDPVTLVAASAIFVAVTVLASLLPAARAAGTAPVDALRAS
jgi:putative ABC transport system permease protein